ncbi:hypothetical protein ABL78_6925 [Leptomonas seymouri]|uniref:CCHC-type domain-containing protein n=1 Tax=Leptomonas seymouri TaxID=5684 RepID=A0A0N0P3T4_LEPSE|nr:hypothetical protein ABL78_6925 [Leptomonas seymouri]|eukprot:KPI84027.1 hypothetical protein ABL78_6925 [Leptomonas seymouri]
MSSPSCMPDAKRLFTPSGFVQCSVHGVRRKAECCEMKPVMNADMEVIDYVCVCKPAFACKSASERNFSHGNSEMRAVGVKRSGEGSGSSPPPIVIDASSTSMTTDRQRGHAGASSSAAAGSGDGGNAEVATLFAVSFYGGSSAAPASTAATVSQSRVNKEKENELGDKDDQSNETEDHPDVNSDASADSITLPFPASPAVAITTAAGKASGASSSQPAAHRARPRYYDPAQGAGGGGGNGGHLHSPVAKVCWNCGMPGHEKPSCPNTLCRTCHQKRGPYGVPHRCMPVFEPSPFVVVPTPGAWKAETSRPCVRGEPEGMSAVRCVACGRNGHFDCSMAVSSADTTVPSSPAKSLPDGSVPLTTPFTCCYCGVRGHTVFECRQRDRVHPDHFERRNQLAAERKAAGGGSGDIHSSNSHYGQQQQQQQQQTRPYDGPSGSPSGNTRYSSSSNSGGYRRERTWGGDDGGRRGDYNNEGDRLRRRYEAPTLNRRDNASYSSTAARHYTSVGDSSYNNRYRSPHSTPQPQSFEQRDRSYGGQGRDRFQGGGGHNDQYDSRSREGRQYGGRRDDQQDSRRRDERSDGRGRRRAKNRDYDSGDDLF